MNQVWCVVAVGKDPVAGTLFGVVLAVRATSRAEMTRRVRAWFSTWKRAVFVAVRRELSQTIISARIARTVARRRVARLSGRCYFENRRLRRNTLEWAFLRDVHALFIREQRASRRGTASARERAARR